LTCYAIRSNAWFEIRVSKVQDVQWEEKAIDYLVLEQRLKAKLVGLVEPHCRNKTRVMQDVIASKGKVRP